MSSESPLRVMITAKEERDEKPYTQIWDLNKKLRVLILGFGNGIWYEIRVVGETPEALQLFRKVLAGGGYRITPQPMAEATLYQQGDECWAGFVFLDPDTKALSEQFLP